jgi:UDP-3-O-[3-hydroxymyristoyl] glucosamine N-acyltransferase
MQFPSPVSAKWIADFINAKILGSADTHATGINEIHKVKEGDIVFVDHPKYYDACLNSAATFIIINAEKEVPVGKTLFITADPFESYLKIVNHFRPFNPSDKMISDSVKSGENTIIMPNVFLGNNVTIGSACIIHPNVAIYDNSVIGDHVEIHSGTVIGSHVEIGANCTIDRGVSDSTIIGMGTIIDNLVHVGHDVVIGKNCILAAQVGIAGGTVLGDGVTLWGQVGVNKTINIGDNAVVMGQAGITSSIEGGKTYWGTPIQEFYSKRKELVLIKRLPEIWERVKDLKK